MEEETGRLMIETRPFKKDREKFYTIAYGMNNPGFLKKLKLCMTNSGLHIVAVYRLGRAATKLYNFNCIAGIIPLFIYWILNHFIKTFSHVYIARRAEIGPGFFLMHHFAIIIGPCRIGSNFTIHHNLTIGQQVAGLDRSIPVIGDNVWIGPQCVITGGITIGNGATISAGTILSKDVPDNCLAAGNPGRVIIRNYDNTTMAVKK